MLASSFSLAPALLLGLGNLALWQSTDLFLASLVVRLAV